MARGNLTLPGALGLLFTLAFIVFAFVFQYEGLYPSYESSVVTLYFVAFGVGAVISGAVFVLGLFGRNA